jgi:hypothetical protein
MKWHAERGIPVEVNEAHQWSLRRAPDVIAVATAFIAAFSAKAAGVREYVSQYMLNTPCEISPSMDLAKMLAKIELIEGLHDPSFTSYRQVRAGILGFPANLDAAKGQLCLSTVTGLMLRPHIVHVVAYCEGQYPATPKEIIESCAMVDRVIHEYQRGFPDVVSVNVDVQRQKTKLLEEAGILIRVICSLGDGKLSALTDPVVLEKAITTGILDAPDLQGSDIAKGSIATAIVAGACVAIDQKTGKPLSENERLARIVNG